MCNCNNCNKPLVTCESKCNWCNIQPTTQNPCLQTPCVENCDDSFETKCIFLSSPVTLCGATLPANATLQTVLETIGTLICGGMAPTDELVKVSATDIIADYLGAKFTDSGTIKKTILNNFGVETIKFDIDFSADAKNIATVGSDGGLYVPKAELATDLDWACLNPINSLDIQQNLQNIVDNISDNKLGYTSEFNIINSGCNKQLELVKPQWVHNVFDTPQTSDNFTQTGDSTLPFVNSLAGNWTSLNPAREGYLVDSLGNVTVTGVFDCLDVRKAARIGNFLPIIKLPTAIKSTNSLPSLFEIQGFVHCFLGPTGSIINNYYNYDTDVVTTSPAPNVYTSTATPVLGKAVPVWANIVKRGITLENWLGISTAYMIDGSNTYDGILNPGNGNSVRCYINSYRYNKYS